MRRKLLRVALLLIAVGLIGAGVWFSDRILSAPFLNRTTGTVQEYEVAPRQISFWVEATGMLKAKSVISYSAPPGFLNYWQFQIVMMAPEGSSPKPGEVILSFESQRVKEDLDRFQNELDRAVKELERTTVQNNLQRQNLEAKLAAAENVLEKRRLKQETSAAAFERLSTLEKDRLACEQAEKEVALVRDELQWHKRASEASFKVIDSKRARADVKVKEIKKGMEWLQVKAEKEGVLVYRTRWNGEKPKVGENIWSGGSVMEMPAFDSMIAELYVPEVDIAIVKIGQPVEITIDAFPGKVFGGQVTSQGTLVRTRAWDIPNRVLDVECTLDRLDTSIMRPAMSLKAKIRTRAVAGRLAIPLEAVLNRPEGAVVKKKESGVWKDQVVQLGESNGTEIIVEQGLVAGDRVAVDFRQVR